MASTCGSVGIFETGWGTNRHDTTLRSRMNASRPAPGGGRYVEISPQRVRGWFERFAEQPQWRDQQRPRPPLLSPCVRPTERGRHRAPFPSRRCPPRPATATAGRRARRSSARAAPDRPAAGPARRPQRRDRGEWSGARVDHRPHPRARQEQGRRLVAAAVRPPSRAARPGRHCGPRPTTRCASWCPGCRNWSRSCSAATGRPLDILRADTAAGRRVRDRAAEGAGRARTPAHRAGRRRRARTGRGDPAHAAGPRLIGPHKRMAARPVH